MNRILRTIVILLAVLAAAALILVYGFRIRTVAVEGNERYPAEEISSDLMSTSLLQNTLYFAWRSFAGRSVSDIGQGKDPVPDIREDLGDGKHPDRPGPV